MPAMAGGSPEAEPVPSPSRPRGARDMAIASLAAAATVFFGVIPGPLLDIAADAGRLLSG